MKKILIFLIIITNTKCNSISSSIDKNLLSTTSEGEKILLGKINHDQLIYFSQDWFLKKYKPMDSKILLELAPIVINIKIKIFMGTWCEDSKREIPILFDILKSIDYDLSSIEIISMSENKTTLEKFEKGLNITNIPTFIFYKNNIELNRIVEFPLETLEKDVFKILSTDDYKHAYFQ